MISQRKAYRPIIKEMKRHPRDEGASASSDIASMDNRPLFVDLIKRSRC